MKLVSDARFTHNGKYLHTAELFEANEQDGLDLIAMGMAHRQPMVDAIVDAITEPFAERVKRQYNRRDLTAKE